MDRTLTEDLKWFVDEVYKEADRRVEQMITSLETGIPVVLGSREGDYLGLGSATDMPIGHNPNLPRINSKPIGIHMHMLKNLTDLERFVIAYLELCDPVPSPLADMERIPELVHSIEENGPESQAVDFFIIKDMTLFAEGK